MRGGPFRAVVVALAGILLCADDMAAAAVRRICDISYETEYGWSRPARVEVVFASGQELNRHRWDPTIPSFHNYAMIWFDQDEVAVLELTDLALVTP